MQKMIEIFCNIELGNVMLLKVQDSNEITTILTDLFEEKPKLVTDFQIGKVKYGFHPELDDLTLGEYIDLDTFIGDWDNNRESYELFLYRPILAKIKDKYSIEEYKLGKEVELLDMPMDAVISSVFFFCGI